MYSDIWTVTRSSLCVIPQVLRDTWARALAKFLDKGDYRGFSVKTRGDATFQ
ncbi:protein of unknown function [uncultured Woeseiaceae bacterium]|uniref:Uncharacterized protein n=1 Tax=uncultured Woeseiaceae bacterium TaxID=1983305 RepID=A0A7D9H3R5_9GAMM|nr:protein of unknown function [uncultured Woeseiaceae bacterium]